MSVPILGQGFKCLASWPTFVMQCTCPGQTVLILTTKDPVECPACHRFVAIVDDMTTRVAEVVPRRMLETVQ